MSDNPVLSASLGEVGPNAVRCCLEPLKPIVQITAVVGKNGHNPRIHLRRVGGHETGNPRVSRLLHLAPKVRNVFPRCSSEHQADNTCVLSVLICVQEVTEVRSIQSQLCSNVDGGSHIENGNVAQGSARLLLTVVSQTVPHERQCVSEILYSCQAQVYFSSNFLAISGLIVDSASHKSGDSGKYHADDADVDAYAVACGVHQPQQNSNHRAETARHDVTGPLRRALFGQPIYRKHVSPPRPQTPHDKASPVGRSLFGKSIQRKHVSPPRFQDSHTYSSPPAADWIVAGTCRPQPAKACLHRFGD